MILNITLLEGAKADLVSYLISKTRQEDWHAVQDAASDIREIEAQLLVLRAQLQSLPSVGDTGGRSDA